MNTRKLYQHLPSLVLILLLWAPGGFADEYSERWGPAVGDSLPLLEATDQAGSTRSFENLKGKNGLLLFMNRSADW